MNHTEIRKAARDRGDTFYTTGVSCRAGHIAPRYVSSGNCLACRESFKRPGDTRGRVWLPAQLLADAAALETVLGWIDELNAATGLPPAARPGGADPNAPSAWESELRAAKRQGLPPMVGAMRARSAGVPETYGGGRSRADYPGQWS